MKFGRTHHWLTSILALIAILAVVVSGALPLVSSILILVFLGVAFLIYRTTEWSENAQHSITIVLIVVFCIEGLRWLLGTSLFEVILESTAALLIARIALRRGAHHDPQIILLILLHLIAGAMLNGGIAYGLCLFGFLILAPCAFMLSHLRREVEGNYRQGARDRTGSPVDVPRILRSQRVITSAFLIQISLLSIPILVFTLVLFILFPRLGVSTFGFPNKRAMKTTGFGSSIDLRQAGMIHTDSAVVLRFRSETSNANRPEKLNLRVRGTAFDYYQNDGIWSHSHRERTPLIGLGSEIPLRRVGNRNVDTIFHIEIEPIDTNTLLIPSHTVSILWPYEIPNTNEESMSLIRSSDSTLLYENAAGRQIKYSTYVASSQEIFQDILSGNERARYLQLPTETTSKMRALAKQWSVGAHTDFEKATQVAYKLSNEFRYTLEAPSSGKPNPIEHFLFDSRAGHCEFFSSSMVLLLRSLDIPARNVVGFMGGRYNRFGDFYAIRQSDAHSWVEAFVEHQGRYSWITFDPTPAATTHESEDANSIKIFAWLRDLTDAMSQSWQHNVVGYDLPKQSSLAQRTFSTTRHKIIQIGHSLSIFFKQSKYYLRLAFVGILFVGFILLVRWRKRSYSKKQTLSLIPQPIQQTLATTLWLQLEQALLSRGISRPAHIPPLRFVEQLTDSQHDGFSQEILELTHNYTKLRFGKAVLSTQEYDALVRRIKQLTTQQSNTTA